MTFRTLKQLASIPRGDREELRIELTESTSDNGEVYRYVNARIWFKGDRGDVLPGKQGITIRKDEIRDFGRALKAALEEMGDDRGPAPVPQQRQAPRTQRRSYDEDPDMLEAGGRL